jgi:hypothetical protein
MFTPVQNPHEMQDRWADIMDMQIEAGEVAYVQQNRTDEC